MKLLEKNSIYDLLIIFIEIFFICCVIVAIICFSKNDNKNYFEEMEIYKLMNCKPKKEFVVNKETYRQHDGIFLVYDDEGTFRRAEIYSDKFKLEKGISVGSKRNDVENAFSKKKIIKDSRENEWGFIEGDIWISFHFDENNNVDLIYLFYGP